MTDIQYELIVKEGTIITETGIFFVAAPFTVNFNDQTVDIVFSRHNIDHVVYQLSLNGQSLGTLEFPDYAPDCDPNDLNSYFNTEVDLMPLFDALVHLSICIAPQYKSMFTDSYSSSFTVNQSTLTVG